MFELGRTLGSYRILRQLGSGGMADVYLAERGGPEGFTKHVALKVIRPELARDRGFRTMFVEEAKIAQTLAHGNVVQIFELGEAEGQYFIAMEHIAGTSLQALLARTQRLPLALSLYIVRCLCRALQHAHTRTDRHGNLLNIVHRDVSPHNVLLAEDGQVKLTDFGIARAKDRFSVSNPGTLKGKVGYFSPEQIEGRNTVDQRSDIFSLGVVAYQMVTGINPLVGSDLEATLMRTLLADITRPSHHAPDLDPEVERILTRALARHPQDRYASAQQLLDELEHVRLTHKDRTDAAELTAFLKAHGDPVSPPPRSLDGALAQVLGRDRPEEDATHPLAPAAPPSTIAAGEAATISDGRHASSRGGRTLGRLWRMVAVGVTLTTIAVAGGILLRRAFDQTAAPARNDGNVRPMSQGDPRDAAPVRDRLPGDQSRPSTHDRVRRRPQEMGELWINLVPWATVSIDGRPVGDTPLRKALPAGRHRVLLLNPPMNLRRELTVVVRPGQTARVERW